MERFAHFWVVVPGKVISVRVTITSPREYKYTTSLFGDQNQGDFIRSIQQLGVTKIGKLNAKFNN